MSRQQSGLKSALAQNLSAQQQRLLVHVRDNPGAFTHEIMRDAGIGNVPCRAGELNRQTLHNVGLELTGTRQPGHKNRFGQPCSEYRWYVVAAT